MKYIWLLITTLISVIPSLAQKAEVFDEFSDLPCDHYLARIDNIVFQAKNNPSLEIYIFVYEGKTRRHKGNGTSETEQVLPQQSLAKAKIRSMKEYISKIRKYTVEQFKFVEAGFQEGFKIQVWLVPTGAIPPKPEPTLTRMKYRKGSPSGFCLGCC
jgi:hypothetical protein